MELCQQVMEDFSNGQFYILEPEYRDRETLYKYHAYARDALFLHSKSKITLTSHGIDVATRLKAEIEKILYKLSQDEIFTIQYNIAQSTAPIDGYVYLIRSSTGAYKIGRSKNPQNRMKTFSVKLPFEVKYECLIATGDMRGLEQALHLRFAHKRINGEWFNLDIQDVEYIKGLAS